MTASASWRALGTTAVVTVERDDALPRASAILAEELERFDAACSRFRVGSDLRRACANAGRPTRVDPTLLRAVTVAIDAAEQTDGLVDPTLGRELREAGYDRTFELVRRRRRWSSPTPRSRSTHTWRNLRVDESRQTLTVPNDVELDLGATAKALAADQSAETIATAVGCAALVSLGGDIAVAGTPREPWVVRVADDHTAPLDTAGPLVVLARGGLATSGSAVRRWRTDDGDAHHLIDPRSGRPAREVWRTVSVAAETCLAANVAATAAYVLGDAAFDWLSHRSVAARLVRPGGEVVHVGGWPVTAEAA